MACVEQFGALQFRTMTPDELASVVRDSLLYGRDAADLQAEDVRIRARLILPIFGQKQILLLLTALNGAMPYEWHTFKDELLQRVIQ